MSFYITCAIDYPNSQPHIGTAYEKIAADTIARYRRLAGEEVFFLMGLDEHSQNVERRAQEQGLTPEEFTDHMADVFRNAWAAVNVEFDDFIRTTEERHKRAVLELLNRAAAAGDLYEGKYTGFYCVSCEAYYQDRDLVDGKCPVHETEPEYREEDNVFFRLSQYTDKLRALYEEHPEFVQPEVRRNELLALLKEGLEDISASRASDGWGIPMPGHEGQAIYVWFDALTNYLAATGFPEQTERYEKFWPADVHLVGKDITRFHAVIWPAMLMSAGVPVPKTIYGHGWVLMDEGRMSKSKGNVVDPAATAERYGADAVRYFLLREAPFGRDLSFSDEKLIARYNADLANDLGNLLQRTLGMAMKYQDGALGGPAGDSRTGLDKVAEGALSAYREAMESFDLQGAIKAAWEIVSAANSAIQTVAPWELAKDPERAADLDAVLSELAVAIRQVAVLLHPVMPERTAALAAALGDDTPVADWRLDGLLDPARAPRRLQHVDALFPRLDVEESGDA